MAVIPTPPPLPPEPEPKNLMICPDCTEAISKNAHHCPHCGRVMKERQTAGGILAAVILGLIGAWIVINLYNR